MPGVAIDQIVVCDVSFCVAIWVLQQRFKALKPRVKFLKLGLGHRQRCSARHLAFESRANLHQIVINGETSVISDICVENQRVVQVPLVDWLYVRSLALSCHNQAFFFKEFD